MAARIAKILLFFLPFHAFFVTWLANDIFVFWKEFLIVVLCVAALFEHRKQGIKDLLRNKFVWLVLVFMIYSTLSVLWSPDLSLNRLIYGIKYEVAFFGLIIAGMLLKNIEFEELLKWTFFGGSLAILVGLILHFVVGPENFIIFGYRNDWSNYGIGQALAFCQKIENSDICRFQGTFSGPNQAAFYLLLYLPIAVHFLKKYKLICAIMVPLSLLALILTYSRSAILGLILMTFAYMVLVNKKWIKDNALKIGVMAIICIGFAAIMYTAAPGALLRPESTSEHFTKWIDGVNALSESPIWGQGLAESGPAARAVYSDPLITESWFLQVAVNSGILGLILFGWIYCWLMWKLYKSNKPEAKILLITLIAMIPPLQLLHAFEDSSTTYSLFLLLGAFLVYNDSKKFNQNI